MPRPALFTVDQLLDAAAVLVAAEGPAAVSMSAVARAAGAPSGSMYHRFPTRAALCGELWIRTEERFLDGVFAALSGTQDAQTRCVAGARFTVAWCRDHPAEAQVLFAGADAMCLADWPDALSSRHRRLNRRLRRVLADTDADPERVHAAVVEIPYAIVRRHLVAKRAIPANAETMVMECARALIAAGT